MVTSSSGEPVIFFTNIFSFLPRPFQSLQEKKITTHVQTDKMSNIGRRKCKYFGAASFSCFSVHFFWNSGTSQFFLLHLSLSCQQAYRCLPSVPSALISASGSFSSHTRRPTGNTKTDGQEREEKKMHSLVCFSIRHADALTHSCCVTRQCHASTGRSSLRRTNSHTRTLNVCKI